MKFSVALSLRLKALMEEKGMSFQELDKRCKLSSSTIRTILAGKQRTVNLASIMHLSNALGMSMHDFFDDDLMTLENLDDDRKRK